MLMLALSQQQQQQQQQSAPGAAYSATDFPALGEVRPGNQNVFIMVGTHTQIHKLFFF